MLGASFGAIRAYREALKALAAFPQLAGPKLDELIQMCVLVEAEFERKEPLQLTRAPRSGGVFVLPQLQYTVSSSGRLRQ